MEGQLNFDFGKDNLEIKNQHIGSTHLSSLNKIYREWKYRSEKYKFLHSEETVLHTKILILFSK